MSTSSEAQLKDEIARLTGRNIYDSIGYLPSNQRLSTYTSPI